VKLFALVSNAIVFASTAADREIAVLLDTAKEAESDSPLGTVAGVQFAAVFQSPLVGFAFHVALPAGAIRTMERELMVSVRLRRKEE
jgi:hypothetical protein